MIEAFITILSFIFMIPLLILGVMLLFIIILPFVALGIIVTIICAPVLIICKIFDLESPFKN